MEFDTRDRVKEIRIKILGRPLVFGIRRSSMVFSMPGLMNGHVTFMKYADPTHPSYNMWDMHVTNTEGEHRTLLDPISDTDFERRLSYLQGHVKDSEITSDTSDFAREKFYSFDNINELVNIERKSRRMDIDFSQHSIESMERNLKVVKGVDIFNSSPFSNQRSIYIQENEQDNMLVSHNGRYLLINQKKFMKEVDKALDFKAKRDALDILK